MLKLLINRAQYQVSDQVLRVLDFEKVSEEELAYMVEQAEIVDYDCCNRRYRDWLFLVHGNHVLKMQRAAVTLFEEHEWCGGKGCSLCGWRRHIGRRISRHDVRSVG